MHIIVVEDQASLAFQDKHIHRGQVDQRPIMPHLELSIERALQGGRRCRRCAAVSGRYLCRSEGQDRGEWRYTDAGVDLIVSRVQHEPGSDPRFRVHILLEKEGRVHARAIYYSEPMDSELLEGPFALKLNSEESECDFAFPVCVELVASGERSAPNITVSLANG